MSKHKAKWSDHTAAYITHDVERAYREFVDAVTLAKFTGDWNDALGKRMRGRVGSKVRLYSDMLCVRVPKKWW